MLIQMGFTDIFWMQDVPYFFPFSGPNSTQSYALQCCIELNQHVGAEVSINYSHLLFCHAIVNYFYLALSVTRNKTVKVVKNSKK